MKASGISTPPTPPQAMQAPPPAMQTPPLDAAPAKRRTSPIVWVLVIILGLFVLGCIGVVGTGLFLVHKARQAGLDPELMRRNPGLAMGKLIAAANPDAEVVSTDDNAGTITIRDRKTGKVMTMTFDQAKNGKFKLTTEGDDGKVASVELGGGDGKLPSWVPNYPGSSTHGNFSVKGASNDGSGEGGNVTFTTSDPAEKVMAFYQDKAKEMGMKVNVTTTSASGGMIIASDEDSKRSLTVVVGGGSSETTVNLTYARKI